MKTIIILTSLIFCLNLQAQKIVDKIERPYCTMMKQKACIIVEKKRRKVPFCAPRYIYLCKKITYDSDRYKIKLWDGKKEIGDTLILTEEIKSQLIICKNYSNK